MLCAWFPTSLFQEVKLQIQSDANSSCCFLRKAQDRDPRQAQAKLSPGMYENFPGAATIVLLVTWLPDWGSLAPSALSAARAGWLVWLKAALACWPRSAASLPASLALAVCICKMQPGSTRLRLSEASSPALVSPKPLLHPQAFFLHLQPKGMMILKGYHVGEKADRKPFWLRNLLSENLHSLFRELVGNSFPWQLCRSAGDKVC